MSLEKIKPRFFAGTKIYQSKTKQKIQDFFFKGKEIQNSKSYSNLEDGHTGDDDIYFNQQDNSSEDQQIKDENYQKIKIIKKALDLTWMQYDIDNEGYISYEIYDQMVQDILSILSLKDLQSPERFKALFVSLDENKNGRLDKHELVNLVNKLITRDIPLDIPDKLDELQTDIRRNPVEMSLDSLWSKYDIDELSYEIYDQMVQDILSILSLKDLQSPERFKALFVSLDENKNGRLDKHELVNLVNKLITRDIPSKILYESDEYYQLINFSTKMNKRSKVIGQRPSNDFLFYETNNKTFEKL